MQLEIFLCGPFDGLVQVRVAEIDSTRNQETLCEFSAELSIDIKNASNEGIMKELLPKMIAALKLTGKGQVLREIEIHNKFDYTLIKPHAWMQA